MEELTEKLSEIKVSIDAIRKTGKLSHWRMFYADTLYTRAQEYVAVDRYPEAKLVAQKLDRWIQAHKLALETNKGDARPPMIFWNADLLNNIVKRIRSTLETKKMLVPSTERDSINRRLNIVDGWIQKGEYLVAHDELLALRSALIARLRRSYRARIVASFAYSGGYVQPAGSTVGLYNSLHTLEETFHIVGEHDPIWIEDFLEIYNDLFRIVDRLVPQDKK
ncbi:hypothetical protein SAMN06298224_1856 [Fibrobacter sp. UWB16]|uniref:hypothetical protein n=1 Tax=Fibrobacter sp. UWB16 TaxID=1945874 RepID=UPI000BD9975C|nr:hypothetical protein [Fibrobacter sp. UWB16]SOD14484.1 hypothetical protein SAMN06298224_1856 [Fibrobacter sp. UWB16]